MLGTLSLGQVRPPKVGTTLHWENRNMTENRRTYIYYLVIRNWSVVSPRLALTVEHSP